MMTKEQKIKDQLEIDAAMAVYTGKVRKIKTGYAEGGSGYYVRWGSHAPTKKLKKKKKMMFQKKGKRLLSEPNFLDREFQRKLLDPKQ